MSGSTGGKPPRTINWLFFDSANEFSQLQSMTISRYMLNVMLGEMRWAASLKRVFKFRAGIINFCCHPPLSDPPEPFPSAEKPLIVGERWETLDPYRWFRRECC